MNFDFIPPAMIQEKKKYANFTLKEIGGPEEIIKWRKEQEAKESIYRLRLGQRDTRLTSFEKEIGELISRGEFKGRNWEEKVMAAKELRDEIAKQHAKVIAYPPWQPREAPKPSLFQRIVGFFKQAIANIGANR